MLDVALRPVLVEPWDHGIRVREEMDKGEG